MIPDTFDDGPRLYQTVCDQGLEGIVAKRSASVYRPGQRGWIQVKNPGYWRRGQEIESLRRSFTSRGIGVAWVGAYSVAPRNEATIVPTLKNPGYWQRGIRAAGALERRTVGV